MAMYYIIETNEFNMLNKHERFVCCDEFMARAVMNMIISVEFTDYDRKSQMTANDDESFIDGWRFWDKTQHFSEGDWITLRKYKVDDDDDEDNDE